MSILSKLTDLGREIAAATRSVQDNIATVREQITAKRKELSDAQGLPIPRRELVERFRAMVDERAGRFARVPPAGQTWTSARDMFRALGRPETPTARVEIRHIEELLDFLCFFAGDNLKAGAPKLLNVEGWVDGLPTNERPTTIARLERELAELESAEERVIDEAAAAGVVIAHRPEVITRRQREAGDRQSLEKWQAGVRERQAAVDQSPATRRSTSSPYLDAMTRDRAGN